MSRGLPSIVFALALAACSPGADKGAATAERPTAAAPAAKPAPAVSAEPAKAKPPALALAGEGLMLFDRESGSSRTLGFGIWGEQLLDALAFRGPPVGGTLDECGAGPLQQASWNDGLTVYFQDGKFVGWAAGGGGNSKPGSERLANAAGIGPGSTRAELDSALVAKVFESTLGTEFAAGDLFGILDGTGKAARITHMWAGISCNFR